MIPGRLAIDGAAGAAEWEAEMLKRKKELVITTLIGTGAECSGDFSAKGSARIDGRVSGNVTVTGTLIVGVEGVINGDISASAAIVGGEVNGNVTAVERVELTSTAKLIGDINTQTIVIDEKAVFQGGCNMNVDPVEKRPALASKVIKAGRRSAKEALAEALKEVEAASHDTSSETAAEPAAGTADSAQASQWGE